MSHFNHLRGMARAFLCLILTTSISYAGSDKQPPRPDNNHGISPENHKGSMFFEKNYGQLKNTDGASATNVLYYAATPKFTWYLTDEGIRYVFSEHDEEKTEYYRLDLNYIGANFSTVTSGAEASKVSYYEGQTTNLAAKAMYQELIVENFYPNIDLELKATKKGFKYNYIVHPGGEVADIQMKYGAHNQSYIMENGDFNITTALGEILESAPYSYQEGRKAQQEIASSFAYENDVLTFEVGEYDPSQTLVIDPLIEVQTYFGGDKEDEAFAIDNNRGDLVADFEIYITGYTTSGSYPTVGGGVTVNNYGTSTTGKDAFVACFDDDMSTLNWVTYLKGTSDEVGRDVRHRLDTGFVYVTGETNSNNFPTNYAAQPTHGGGVDAFAVKLDANNGTRKWCTYIGDVDDEYGTSIDVENDEVRVAGYSNSNTITGLLGAQPTYTVPSTTNSGGNDAFLIQFSAYNGAWHWGTFLGGSNDDFAYDVTMDASPGTFWVSGAQDNGTDLDVVLWTMQHNGPNGVTLGTTHTYGGTGDQIAYEGTKTHGTIDGLTLVGSTTAGSFSPSNSVNQAYNTGTDGFLLNINTSSSNNLDDANYTGGDGTDYLTHAEYMPQTGQVVCVGITDDELDIVATEYTTCSADRGFSWAVSADGADSWGDYLDCQTEANGVTVPFQESAVLNCGAVYITGATWNTNLSETSGSFQTLLDQAVGGSGGTGMMDAFICRQQILIGPIQFDYDIFCRRTNLALFKSNGTAYDANRKKTALSAYPGNGHFYGEGTYYDESSGDYYFHPDTGTVSGNSATVTYRIAWGSACILETTHDFGIIGAYGDEIYPVICSSGTPAVNDAEMEIEDYYPAGVTPAYEWEDAATTTVATTASHTTPTHDTYYPKATYTATSGLTDGCLYDGTSTANGVSTWSVFVDADISRITFDMNHEYDYYDDGNVTLAVNQSRGSMWRYFHYPANYPFTSGGAPYNGPKWYKGIMGGTSAYQNEGISYSPSTQGSYYVSARNRCDATASDVMTDDDGHATVNNNAHCRTDNHEKVLDSNNPSWARGRVKEHDGSDYFSGTASKYFIEGRLDILPGATVDLSSAELTLAPDAQIHIYPGGALDLSNCQITTCNVDDPWSYIKVYGSRGIRHDDAVFTFKGTAGIPVIERGRLAVRSAVGGKIDIANTTFNDNLQSIFVNGTDEDGDVEIHNSTFNPARGYAAASWHPTTEDAYIGAHNADYMDITGNTFVGTSPNENYYGIYIKDGANNDIQTNVFENGYLDYAMYFDNVDGFTVSGNTVCDNKSSLGACNIDRGLYMKYTSSTAATSTIEDNSFKYLECGMEYYHSNPPASGNTIAEGNEFIGNTYGAMVFSQQDATNLYGCPASPVTNAATTNDINLKFKCNDFYSNDVGIIGGGKLKNQGNNGGTDHGNDWGTGATVNHHYDFMWYNGGTDITWFNYDNAGSNNGPNQNVTSTMPDYCINGTNITYNTIDYVDDNTGQTLNGCGSLPPPVHTTLDEEKENTFDVFPNPFNNHIIVNTHGDVGNNINVTLFDLSGRSIYSNPYASAGTVTIPTNGIGHGAYILQIIPENGEPKTFKVIKN